MELYLAHFGNQSYVVKVMGLPVTGEDYLIGYIVLGLLIVAIIGPLYFFSEFSNFSINNPVKNAEIRISLIINKTLSIKDLESRTVTLNQMTPSGKHMPMDAETDLFVGREHKTEYEEKNLKTTVPYKIYDVEHPNFRNLDEFGYSL
jgi:hypothetical protein